MSTPTTPATGSDTPRTDEQERRYDRIWGAFEGDRRELVYVDFARTLERELADAEHSNMNHRDYIGRLEVDRKDLRAQLATGNAYIAALEEVVDPIGLQMARHGALRTAPPSVHTCSDKCQRPLCVLRRELAAALAEVQEQARLLSMSGERESGLLATIQHMEDELEQQSWKISPAMAQAQIDQLNATIAELQTLADNQAEDIERLLADKARRKEGQP